ncbi:MAG: hypothetical protein KF773_40900 [Deltaproteobacteria bacterium]|nr:hypothetical protein [Deltaproteobacteria bacterium]
MDRELRREAVVFSRYLVRAAPSEALIERYCAANRELFAHEAPSAADAAVLAFARDHAWAVAPLDAGHALLGPASLLRKKLLVMTAILETTPEYAARTEPRAVALPMLGLRLAAAGVAMAAGAAAGLALTLALRHGK